MPHDKTGQLIDVNDVVTIPYYEKGEPIQKSAVVKAIIPGTETCDLEVSVLVEQLVPTIVHATAAQATLVSKGTPS